MQALINQNWAKGEILVLNAAANRFGEGYLLVLKTFSNNFFYWRLFLGPIHFIPPGSVDLRLFLGPINTVTCYKITDYWS